MPKRKEQNDGSDSDVSLVDVDFEFFDPNPTDYIALKRLLTQLFQSDSELLHLHDLAELILSQPLVGTTVKTDGRESDPYAFLTVLNLVVHKNNPAIKALIEYTLKKASSSNALHSALQALFSEQQVGFIFSERLINMPVQIVPPMYRMLSDEIKWANEENEPYTFSHYLIIARTYRLSPEDESAMEGVEMVAPPAKRTKKRAVRTAAHNGDSKTAVYSFHPEDEQIQKFASHTLDYEFTSTQPREQDSFGLDMAARMMIVPADRFALLVEAISVAYAVPS